MIRALYTSENALLTQQNGVDSISNNISNINTIGYKRTRPTFASLFSQTMKAGTATTNPMQIGLGSILSSTDTILTQGELMNTDKTTDVALEGKGFFTLLNPNAQQKGAYYFTRAGDFSFDADNNLVNPEGYKVVGWLAQPAVSGEGFEIPKDETTGIPTGDVEPINIANYESVPAVSSTYIRFKANLNGGDSVKEYSAAEGDKNFDVLFDSNGHSLDVQDGNNFKVSYDNGNTWHTYEYDSNGSVSQGAEGFTTLGDLVNLMNSDMSNDGVNAAAEVNNGSIEIRNNSTTDNLNIKVQPATDENQKLTTIISNLNQVIAPSKTASTQQVNVATHIVHSFFYDSSGEKHKIDIVFKKIATNRWSYEAVLPDGGGSLTNNTGVITFDNNGGLSEDVTSPTIGVKLNSGYQPTQLTLNLWDTDSGSYEGNQYSGLTQFALDSDTSFQDQDGSPSGRLEKVNIDYQGNIVGSYSNGKSYSIAQLAVSTFTNPQGLKRIGNTMFALTQNVDNKDILASNGYIGVANKDGRGSIISSHLEMSNVDLSKELTDLIVYQRAFQADSKGVTTADEIIQTAIQLKR